MLKWFNVAENKDYRLDVLNSLVWNRKTGEVIMYMP